MNKFVLNEREAAAALGVSLRHLQRLRLAGEVPFVRLGARRVGYSVHQLYRWLDERAVTEDKKSGMPEEGTPRS